MIVVDTNVIAYLYLPTSRTTLSEHLLTKFPRWAAPSLWRSELRNVLALYLRRKVLTLEQALRLQAEAEALMSGSEFDLPSADVLGLAAAGSCSAYDCEFVALARHLGTRLVTADRKLVRAYPRDVISLEDAAH